MGLDIGRTAPISPPPDPASRFGCRKSAEGTAPPAADLLGRNEIGSVQFNSTAFFLFFPIVAVLYFALGLQARRWLLLAASLFFYAFWSVPFSLLLVLSTFVDYFAAAVISGSRRQVVRRSALIGSLVVNLGLLGLFKYADFFTNSAYSLFGVRPWPELDLILPLGISFYTFQTISYTIDVYRGQIEARKSILDVALYVSFFPQLVAGPIIRASILIPALRVKHAVDWIRIRAGLALIIWGLLKKVLIADSMAPIVEEAYANPGEMSGLALLTATYAFAVQIYCDFSGYTDIAIGCARILGVDLPKNFDAPYLACSIREFWRRWHISLSTWLRDYLYIPLGGSRKGETRTYLNLMTTMLIGGLWHGAGWNWVVWGGLQGVLMSIERLFGIPETPPQRLVPGILRWLVTIHLVCASWVLFRAASLEDAMLIFGRMATASPGLAFDLWWPTILLLAVAASGLLKLRQRLIAAMASQPILATLLSLAMLALLAAVIRGSRNPEFIYFQF
jgi:alginate O-acetyltransferase complex protein AlgI